MNWYCFDRFQTGCVENKLERQSNPVILFKLVENKVTQAVSDKTNFPLATLLKNLRFLDNMWVASDNRIGACLNHLLGSLPLVRSSPYFILVPPMDQHYNRIGDLDLSGG